MMRMMMSFHQRAQVSASPHCHTAARVYVCVCAHVRLYFKGIDYLKSLAEFASHKAGKRRISWLFLTLSQFILKNIDKYLSATNKINIFDEKWSCYWLNITETLVPANL